MITFPIKIKRKPVPTGKDFTFIIMDDETLFGYSNLNLFTELPGLTAQTNLDIVMNWLTLPERYSPCAPIIESCDGEAPNRIFTIRLCAKLSDQIITVGLFLACEGDVPEDYKTLVPEGSQTGVMLSTAMVPPFEGIRQINFEKTSNEKIISWDGTLNAAAGDIIIDSENNLGFHKISDDKYSPQDLYGTNITIALGDEFNQYQIDKSNLEKESENEPYHVHEQSSYDLVTGEGSLQTSGGIVQFNGTYLFKGMLSDQTPYYVNEFRHII